MKTDIFDTNKMPVTLTEGAERMLPSLSVLKLGALILATLAASFRSVAIVSGAVFTRPADTTAYASGDLVANSTTAGSVTPIALTLARASAGVGIIRRIRLRKSSTSVTNASFRVHFYGTAPTVTNGDNGVWLSTRSSYLGSADVVIDKAFSDAAAGVGAPNTGTEIAFAAAANSKTIYALIEARAAYTPSSAETFTLSAEIVQS